LAPLFDRLRIAGSLSLAAARRESNRNAIITPRFVGIPDSHGEDVERRRQFIEQHALEVKNLDV
jgi:hypothetical protein